jgi:DNA replication protein DnaC
MTNLALVDANEKVETCSKHGAFTSTATLFKYLGTSWSGCPRCEAEREAEREVMRREQDAADAKREFDERFRSANIPQRFFHKSLAGYEAKTASQRGVLAIAKEYAENFAEHLKVGRCLIFSGNVGCGKTHLSCAILRWIVERPFVDTGTWRNAARHSVKYTTAAEVIGEIRSTWGKRELREADVFKSFARPHLLVLDEVGVQCGSKDERRLLQQVIDHRYRDLRPTIVCSNLSKSEMSEFIGERGYDRLRENGGLLVLCDWESHRGSGK